MRERSNPGFRLEGTPNAVVIQRLRMPAYSKNRVHKAQRGSCGFESRQLHQIHFTSRWTNWQSHLLEKQEHYGFKSRPGHQNSVGAKRASPRQHGNKEPSNTNILETNKRGRENSFCADRGMANSSGLEPGTCGFDSHSAHHADFV
jgi:hypothetical protein